MRPPPSGSSPTLKATRPASAPGRPATSVLDCALDTLPATTAGGGGGRHRWWWWWPPASGGGDEAPAVECVAPANRRCAVAGYIAAGDMDPEHTHVRLAVDLDAPHLRRGALGARQCLAGWTDIGKRAVW